MMEAYKEYLRSEVKSVLPLGSLIIGISTLIFIVMCMVKGEFKNFGEKQVVGPNLMYLFMSSAFS